MDADGAEKKVKTVLVYVHLAGPIFYTPIANELGV